MASTSLEFRHRLATRASMLAAVRQFFTERGVVEVDTPLLSKTAPIATHIDIMTVAFENGTSGYLHSSPEYAMKRLLSQGSGDIYQMSHVFREGERGSKHHPEFTMIEWYRVGISLETLIEETIGLIELFVPRKSVSITTYREAFERFAGIDYRTATADDLHRVAEQHGLTSDPAWDKETFLHFVMGFLIEPQFQGLTVLKDYPASQAALSQIVEKEGDWVAERFEIYYNGMELANGFHELTDVDEQRRRFIADNRERELKGKRPLPIDESFLSALESGLPDCCGVAVGFDRLLMLHQNASTIDDVLPVVSL